MNNFSSSQNPKDLRMKSARLMLLVAVLALGQEGVFIPALVKYVTQRPSDSNGPSVLSCVNQRVGLLQCFDAECTK